MRTARATAPAARVYSGPSTAAATAGPAASSGSMPGPGPTTIRATPTAAMIANGSADSISDALDRPVGLGLLDGVSALVLVVTIPPQLVVKGDDLLGRARAGPCSVKQNEAIKLVSMMQPQPAESSVRPGR